MGEWKLNDEILGKLKEIEAKLDQMVTYEEFKQVVTTLETIVEGEVSASKEKVEDKAEAGDMLLKSLLDGLETRINRKFGVIETNQLTIMENINGLLEKLDKKFEQDEIHKEKLNDLLEEIVDKHKTYDDTFRFFDERLRTLDFIIRRKLGEL